MDPLSFISSLVHDLVWPALAVAAFVVAYMRASHLARLIKSIRYGDLEITLHDQFSKAQVEAEAVREKLPPLEESLRPRDDQALNLAKIDPNVALMDTWQRLEGEITKIIQHEGYMRWVSPRKFVDHLHQLGLISHNEVTLFDTLRSIRNSVAHSIGASATIAQVVEYNDFIDSFVQRLQSIKEPLKDFPLPPVEDFGER
jgi:hypothetical protein